MRCRMPRSACSSEKAPRWPIRVPISIKPAATTWQAVCASSANAPPCRYMIDHEHPALDDALAQLPEKCRQAYIRHRLDGLTQPEIADGAVRQ